MTAKKKLRSLFKIQFSCDIRDVTGRTDQPGVSEDLFHKSPTLPALVLLIVINVIIMMVQSYVRSVKTCTSGM